MLTLIEQNQRQIDEAKSRIETCERENAVLREALAIHRDMSRKGQLSLSGEDIKDKSHIKILKLIASRNGGLLLVKEAVRAMKEADVFGNPGNADSAVYSVLNRRKGFAKISPGLYRLVERRATPDQT